MGDLTIIGAGPVGSFLASLCSPKLDVLLLEEHALAGKKPCSGLVSDRIKRVLPKDVINSPGLVQNKVRGAKIHLLGNVFEVKKSKKSIYVINRDLLDKRLAEHAMSSGTEIKFGERAEKVSVLKNKVLVKTKKKVYESRMVAGCGGARSIVARHIGSKPPILINGLIAIEDQENHSDYVEMWFDSRCSKDGFFWKIPRGSQTEFGAMGRGLNFSHLDRFFSLGKRTIVKRSAAPIPMGVVRTFSSRLILVGDSACQVKPWTGGGVTYGLLSAQLASKTIMEAYEKDDFSAHVLSAYEDSWKGILLRDIKAGLVFRELCKDLEGADISLLVKKMTLLKGMGNGIDFDFPFSGFLGEILEI